MANEYKNVDWSEDDAYWRQNYRDRPYFQAGRDYDFYQPGYRFGYDAASRYQDRQWNDVESNLSRDWDRYEQRGISTWQQVKDAVRDAWDRVTGRRVVSTR